MAKKATLNLTFTRMKFDEVLEKLGPKDRLNAERHLAACDSRHADLWKRVVSDLMSLAGHAAKLNGQQSAQFYVADGKYRMQVFALEDKRDGKITIYSANVLDEAEKAGIFSGKREEGDNVMLKIAGTQEELEIEELDGRTNNPAPFYKDMLGWNRKAIRIMLPTGATDKQVGAVEDLCAISAKRWLAAAQAGAAK